MSSGSVERTINPIGSPAAYTQIEEPIRLWADGAAVRLFALGGDLPALDEVLVGPGPLVLVEPTLLLSESIVVDRAQPLEARWTGGAGAKVVVEIAGRTASEDYFTVKCSFSPGAGAGTIPANALTELEPGWQTELLVWAEDYRVVQQGPWRVQLSTRRDFSRLPVSLQ